MINNVVLVGRLTKDPDLRYTSNGSAVSTFNLAVERPFTTKSGAKETDFISCVIWRKSAEVLANYARKGSLIGIVGRIQTRNYENAQGQRVYVTEIVCESFQLLESKKINEDRIERSQATATPGSESKQEGSSSQYSSEHFGHSNPFTSGQAIDISDDDLPF